ncbi:hypothetical protein AIOL_001748 [Candidatus Rhodobacter oscarellae]|uniref:Uncharacterized protein n=2 Tax=Candidatus Rhodobacter oscarellae TaxID=1675527 RepID=A0A0J9E277_9RHOB|nr:hypothetical protein AIOL_001748 [Candidatus Rhodobacter lobularis]
MINPYATSFMIAARLDRALPRHPSQQQLRRWDAPPHWRDTGTR